MWDITHSLPETKRLQENGTTKKTFVVVVAGGGRGGGGGDDGGENKTREHTDAKKGNAKNSQSAGTTKHCL